VNNERPRPQFGELAPEGWTWTPPGDADTSASPGAGSADGGTDTSSSVTPAATASAAPVDTVTPVASPVSQPPASQPPAAATGSAPHSQAASEQSAQSAVGPTGEPEKKKLPSDLFTSIALMVIGLYFTITGTPDLVRLRLTMNQIYELQNLGDYPAGAGAIVDQIGIIAAVVQSVILLAVIGLTTWLIGKRKRSFYVPLAGGVLAILCNVVAVSIALFADPNIINTLSSR
jgi:hypothetical protein